VLRCLNLIGMSCMASYKVRKALMRWAHFVHRAGIKSSKHELLWKSGFNWCTLRGLQLFLSISLVFYLVYIWSRRFLVPTLIQYTQGLQVMQHHDAFLDKCLKQCMLFWPQILKVCTCPTACLLRRPSLTYNYCA